MADLSLETLSMVGATLDEVRAARSAVMLRMWHHLDAAPDREAMFGIVVGDGQQTFVDRFLFAVDRRIGGRWPQVQGWLGLRADQAPVLEDAFRRALADVLGPRSNALLLNAWGLALHAFLAQSHGG